ncbi:MAG TPA: response regulator transcription factor [Mariprofundaceae bacterium]|nr:response regulator transcription factor [Mariprofundaceae bacterium]
MDILIADDHALHRELMRTLIERVYPDAAIREAMNYSQTTAGCAKYKPELLILDVFMPGMNGLMGVNGIVKQFPQSRVLVCSGVENPILVSTMLAFGVCGYISKNISASKLLKAIGTVLNGKTFVPKELMPAKDISLTQRQAEILGMMYSGLTNKEIAQTLDLSLSTVKFHVSLVLKALGVENRQQAVSACGLARTP